MPDPAPDRTRTLLARWRSAEQGAIEAELAEGSADDADRAVAERTADEASRALREARERYLGYIDDLKR